MKNMNTKKAPLFEYFNINDGIEVVWAHAVNSKAYLEKVLSDPKIMILEADVLMDPQGVPIMAHPPATTSDITLQEWLHKCAQTNKGIKLDYKQTSVAVKSKTLVLNFIKNYHTSHKCDENMTMSTTDVKKFRPILLNADVLLGPNSKSNANHVDAKVFFKTCDVPDVILSPGWVTEFRPDGVGYSWNNVREMFLLVKDLKQFITFPIRASLAGRSKEPLIWLLEQNINRFSLTIWTSKSDKYDVKELLYLRKYKLQIYFDLPEEEIKELLKHSPSDANSGVKKGSSISNCIV